MKTTLFLNCLMLLIPFDTLAHPGHAIAPGGFSIALLWSLALLTGFGLFVAAIMFYRRRKVVRVDD